MCLNGAEVTYKLIDSRGAEIGSGLIAVNSTLSTSYKSLDVTETITAKVIRVTGDVQSLTLRMQVGCGTGCTPVTKQPWYATTLGYGQEVTGKTKYRGDPFATGKTRVSFRTNYAMYVTMPGATPVDSSATWSSPRGRGDPLRCRAAPAARLRHPHERPARPQLFALAREIRDRRPDLRGDHAAPRYRHPARRRPDPGDNQPPGHMHPVHQPVPEHPRSGTAATSSRRPAPRRAARTVLSAPN